MTPTPLPVATAPNLVGRWAEVSVRTDSKDLYIGGPDVTATNGYSLRGDVRITRRLTRGSSLWAVAKAGKTGVLQVLTEVF